MDRTELIENHNTTLYNEGRRLGSKSALAGSVVFAFLYLVLLYVNTYLIERIDTPWDLESLFFDIFITIFWTIVVWWVAWVLSYFPALFLGGRLANSLESDANKHVLSKEGAIAKGVLYGVVGACMICLPILVLEFLFILLTRHGDFMSGVFLSVEVIIIASIAGGWTGKQLERLIIR
jgi:hypothetical protein